ncbi:TRAP transporter small permease [Gelria sp. Kuro-4]|uniref:TRAP transporter small permease n=1 Tax=Gelria sp. Kuro-4 TaxID=2796927 RepID=UPI001BED4A33|nr:TRAP transporter small permease [Gelria sp. Kuro-4]BCV24598.1 hypothetical protein kuro4_13710 [Gelria sp. Kuro-4]
MKSLDRPLSLLANAASAFVTFLLFASLATTFTDVLMRSLIRKPLLWGQEVSLICFIWTVFLGAGIGVSNRAHFFVDVLPPLPKKLNTALQIFVEVCILVFAYFLFSEGYRMMILGLNRFSRPSGIPMFYIFAAIPASGAMMILYTVRNLITEIGNLRGEG